MTAGNLCLTCIFWAALLLPLYSYALFPPMVVALGALVQRHRAAHIRPDSPQIDAVLPRVAIVVSAYNEERHVAELIANLLALEYPQPLTLYIGSDGSSDRTAAILDAHASARVRAFIFSRNRGKASVLNDLVAASSEPVIVFTDANTRLEADALLRLAQHFEDPDVGAVCGELSLRPDGDGNSADGIYWRIERALKSSEGTLGALLGANGGIYAIRRECFVPIAPDTLIDDFCIAMTASLSGKSLQYEPSARAHESTPTQLHDEFTRRVRIGIGNYQAFFRHPEYLLRTNPMRSFAYLSHKVLRWFTPHLMLLALVSNALLLSFPLYRLLFWTQIAGYGVGLMLFLVADRISTPKALRLPVFLLAMNVAFGFGFWRFVTGRYSGSWRRTART